MRMSWEKGSGNWNPLLAQSSQILLSLFSDWVWTWALHFALCLFLPSSPNLISWNEILLFSSRLLKPLLFLSCFPPPGLLYTLETYIQTTSRYSPLLSVFSFRLRPLQVLTSTLEQSMIESCSWSVGRFNDESLMWIRGKWMVAHITRI